MAVYGGEYEAEIDMRKRFYLMAAVLSTVGDNPTITGKSESFQEEAAYYFTVN